MRLVDDPTLEHLRSVLVADDDDVPSAGPKTTAAAVPAFGPFGGGRFQVTATLGDGGMGSVYVGVDRTTDREVAIKLIHVGDDEQDRRFDREVQILSRVSHPNIVSYVAHGEESGGSRYLVTEVLGGGALSKRLDDGPLDLPALARVGAAVARALAYLHEHHIIHRDVKPANIVIGARDTIKLIDFGIALGGEAAPLTLPGYAVGTPGYAAPEQVRGGVVGPPADVYGLGATLAEAATGRAPDGPQGVSTLLELIAGSDAPPEPDRHESIPFAVAALLTSMTAAEPRHRPEAHLVAERFERIASELDHADAAANRGRERARSTRRDADSFSATLGESTLGSTTLPETPRARHAEPVTPLSPPRAPAAAVTVAATRLALLWVDRDGIGCSGADGDAQTVALARFAAGPSGALPSAEAPLVVVDASIDPVFSPWARLRAIAAQASVRGLSGCDALAALAVRHGRYLGAAAAARLATSYLATLSPSERQLENEARIALGDLGRLQPARALGRRCYEVTLGLGEQRISAYAVATAKSALLSAAGKPALVLVSTSASRAGTGWVHRLEAIAVTG